MEDRRARDINDTLKRMNDHIEKLTATLRKMAQTELPKIPPMELPAPMQRFVELHPSSGGVLTFGPDAASERETDRVEVELSVCNPPIMGTVSAKTTPGGHVVLEVIVSDGDARRLRENWDVLKPINRLSISVE